MAFDNFFGNAQAGTRPPAVVVACMPTLAHGENHLHVVRMTCSLPA